MKKKWAVGVGVIVILLGVIVLGVILQGGEKGDNAEGIDCTTLQMDFVDFPTEVSRQSLTIVQALWKQQNYYKSEDGTKRLILEVALLPKEDATTVRDESGFYEPESDEAIYEWTQSGMACKLFGTFTEEELESMAESVRVECNE